MVYKKCKLRFPEKKDLTVIGELAMRRVSLHIPFLCK